MDQDDTLRNQKLQACELALGEGIDKNNEAVLRWFTSEILHFSWAWASCVALALMDKTSAGDYRWRNARNPLGMVRVIARRTALKWHPELLFGNDADKVLRPQEPAVSSLRGSGADSGPGTYADAEDESTGGGSWHDEFIERAVFEAEQDYPNVAEFWDHLDSAVLGEAGSLSFDWDEIGQRLGFPPDCIVLMKARAKGVTRASMSKHLLWDEQKVERVWRAVNRYLEKPETVRKAWAKLC